MKRKGVVTALHREPAGGEAPYMAASLITSPDSTLWQPIQAAPLLGWPPPRAMCWFEETGNGSWLCLGSVGGRRVLLSEDFTISTAGNLYGDTAWRQAGMLGTLAGTYTPDGLGVTKLTNTAVTSDYLSLIKGNLSIVAIDALWFSARVLFPNDGTNALANLLVGVGLASDDFTNFVTAAGAGDNAVFAQRQDGALSGNWSLRTRLEAAADLATDSGVAAALGVWYWIDIVHSAGAGWASMWVDGVGPTTNTGASLPVPDAGYQPFATVHNLAAASRRLSIDYIGLEYFTAAVTP